MIFFHTFAVTTRRHSRPAKKKKNWSAKNTICFELVVFPFRDVSDEALACLDAMGHHQNGISVPSIRVKLQKTDEVTNTSIHPGF